MPRETVLHFRPSEVKSISEAALAINVSPATAWIYVQSGRLKATRVGGRYIVLQRDIDDFNAAAKARCSSEP